MISRPYLCLFGVAFVCTSLGCDKESRRDSRGSRIELKQPTWIDKVTSYVDGTGPEARAAISGEEFKIPLVMAPKIHSRTMYQNVIMLCKQKILSLTKPQYHPETDSFVVLLEDKMDYSAAKLACETFPSGRIKMRLATQSVLGALINFVQGPIESENINPNHKNNRAKKDNSQKYLPTNFVCPLLVHADSENPNEHSLYLFGGSSPNVKGQTADINGPHNAICVGSA